MAEAGAYFRAGTAPGAPVACSITAAYSATAAVLCLVNATARRVQLDYIRLLVTTAPASATAGHWAISADTVNRYGSGGSSAALAHANMLVAASAPASGLTGLYLGAVVAAGAGTYARTVSRGQARAVIPVVGDAYIWQFGGDIASQAGVINGTNPQAVQFSVPPVVLPSTGSLLLHLWFPGNAATPLSAEIEAGWWER